MKKHLFQKSFKLCECLTKVAGRHPKFNSPAQNYGKRTFLSNFRHFFENYFASHFENIEMIYFWRALWRT